MEIGEQDTGEKGGTVNTHIRYKSRITSYPLSPLSTLLHVIIPLSFNRSQRVHVVTKIFTIPLNDIYPLH